MKLQPRLLEALAANKPHGIERPAVGIASETVDRDDPRVLQPAGDLRLGEEPRPALQVVGMPVLNLFECDLAVQFGVARDEDVSEPSPVVEAENLEPEAEPSGLGSAGMRIVLSGSFAVLT